MAKKKKYYVVWEGNNTGIFESWTECQLQIKGYPGARYKSFPTHAEAEAAYHGGSPQDFYKAKKSKPVISEAARKNIVWDSICVDAACSGNPGDMEYRGVLTQDATELFLVGPLKMGTNNIGEFLALVHGLALLKKEGKPNLPIYTDSKIAMGWIKKKQINTKLARTRHNQPLFELVIRGQDWLKANSFKNPILKWNTKEWGEIPADFGRK